MSKESVRIDSDGTVSGTKLVLTSSGQQIDGVTVIAWERTDGEMADATIQIKGVKVNALGDFFVHPNLIPEGCRWDDAGDPQ